MYIEEIILEGFKSYATRTSITGWDPEFNAITGLNGTGKSNILDAICFVLGIDNLRQVRAASLQDLVYKKGQAGITKAAVTVVFNNSETSQSPIGFADCPQVAVTRQIVLNGKNKYLINGHVAQQKTVENLFQSVQLNVNNPHFLIMQGQITRVLNMKPQETLALIEESAGTRMFEDRKSKAIGTLENKERKVEEISNLLADAIEPKLKALKAERVEFLEYKRTESDLERLQRLLWAFEYMKDSKAIELEQDKLNDIKVEITDLNLRNKHNKLELETIQDEIFNVTKKKEKETKANGRLYELEESCREAAASMVMVQTQIDCKKDSLIAEEANLSKLSKELASEQNNLGKLESSLEKLSSRYKESEGRRKELAAKLHRDEDLLRSLETGISSGDAKETGYAKLLKDSRDKLGHAQTALYQAQQRVKLLKGELVKMEKDVKSAQKENQKACAEIEHLSKDIASYQQQNPRTLVKPEGLFAEQQALLLTRAKVSDNLDKFKGSANSVEFRYTNQIKNFDHEKIKGMVAKLVRLDKEKTRFASGLEVTAGARLYNIVVEDEKTASVLLQQGKLARRTTFIPLGKIQSRIIPSEKVCQAVDATNGKAYLALSLIEFDNSVSRAMEYVFGSTFICETKEAAALIAFDKRFGFRAVTIEGDVYEP